MKTVGSAGTERASTRLRLGLIGLVVGGLFIGHGTQKLFGWFGGPGPDGTEQMMYKIDMHPARRHAFAAGLTETAGGALLTAGLATPLAAACLIGAPVWGTAPT